MNRFVSWLTRDIAIKVVALLIAALLWFQAAQEHNPIVTVELSAIPVSIVEVPADMTVLESFPRSVTVRIRGSREQIDRLTRSEVIARARANTIGNGIQESLDIDVRVPDGLQVVEVRPGRIDITVDRITRRQVPVDVVIDGRPSGEFRVGEVVSIPADVLIEGPQSVIDDIAVARVRIDVAGTKEDVAKTLPLTLIDEDDKVVTGVYHVPQMVDVVVAVAEIPPMRELPVQVEVQGQVATGFTILHIEHEPESISVRGSAGQIAGMGPIVLGPIDVDGAEDTVMMQLPVEVPPGVTVIGQSVCNVSVVIEPETQKTITSVPVSIINVGTGLTAEVDVTTVNVQFTGPQSLIADVEMTDITLQVDAADLEPGQHEVELEILRLRGMTARISPDVVLVTISDGSEDEQ